MTDKKKENKVKVVIDPIKVNRLVVEIVGKTPLLMDRFSEETKKDILAKQTGISKSIKKQRDVEKEQKQAIHYTHRGEAGFPSSGFKAGMIESTSFVGDKFFSKKLVRGVKILNGPIIPIKFRKQDILEHSIGGITKFSPQFHEWTCKLELLYDANNISPQDLVSLLNYSGYYYGIGMWRPGCRSGGDFGMFEVKTK